MSVRQITTIDVHDIELLQAGRHAIGVDEFAGQAFHLRVSDEGRTWIIESEVGQFVAEVRDTDDDGRATGSDEGAGRSNGWFPISERLVRFGETVVGEPIRLSLADERTMVAAVDGMSAAVDLVQHDGPRPRPITVAVRASATVPARQFMAVLWAARCLPSGVEQSGYPTPPMWMQIGDGSLGLHVDWSDFIPSQATYRCAAEVCVGRATVAVPHAELAALVGDLAMTFMEGEAELVVEVGTVERTGRSRDALMVRSGPWRLVLWLQHPLRVRWAARIDAELADEDIEVLSTNGVEWVVAAGEPSTPGGPSPAVRVTLHHGHPDVARVSAAVTAHVVESLELLRELSALNAASTGVRFWLEDDVVHAATDVRCSALATLPSAVDQVAAAVAAYGGVLAALGA